MDSGSLHITDDVIISIVRLELDQIENVKLSDISMVNRIYPSENAKDIQVKIDDDDIYIDIRLETEYGIDIIAKCNEIQEKIREIVINMTGFNVQEVNIKVKNIGSPTEERNDG